MRFATDQVVGVPTALALANEALAELAAAKVRFLALVFGVVLGLSLGVGGFAAVCDRDPHPAVSTSTTPPARPATDLQPPLVPEPHPEVIPPAVDAPPKPGTTFTALLRGVDAGPPTVTLRVREVNATYPLTGKPDIRIDGRSATIADLVALRVNARVKVTLTAERTEVLRLMADGETVTGTLRAVDPGQNTISLLRSTADAKGTPTAWPLSPTAAVTLGGNPATLGELREGLSVSVRLSADGKRVLALEAEFP
jgi:hypothetical protein